MNFNALDIQHLIIADISGSITAEEKAQLERLMSEYAVIRQRYEQLKKELAVVNTASVREKHASSSKLLEIAHRRKRNKTIRNRSIAACITGICILGGLTYYQYTQQIPEQIALLHDKNVELIIGDKKVDLECETCDINANGYVLHSNNKQLTYTGANGEATLATLTVPAGKYYNVVLDDGTIVSMNAASKLKFPMKFKGNTREITISGEAYLQIALDASHPFIVHLPDSYVQVLGTEFNVNTYDSGTVKVSLVKGKVKMNAGTDSIILQEGNAASYTGTALKVDPFDENEVLSWKSGMLTFSGISIDEIARKILPRYLDIHLVIDPSASGKKFTGVIDRNKPIEDFLYHLTITNEITHYTKNGVIHLQ
ncbi:FecR family protein [Chitinophaga sp. CF118]|uniref:FecR domain-containing protein n=1 Tax=Chitinophaga sp. CF118 TaxID=1884367 RepID=UPI0008E60849|nr:FecR domain-containing protein [Chitinophaga sp. CF118]SFE45333.1 FecR family protein [Chitinophaga sp. CF118]